MYVPNVDILIITNLIYIYLEFWIKVHKLMVTFDGYVALKILFPNNES